MHNQIKIFEKGIRYITFLVVAFAIVLSSFQLLYTNTVAAAPVTGFNPGRIMNDGVFTNNASMSVADIQIFLNAKGVYCTSGSNCLKNYTQDGKSSAQIIYDTAQTYRINPQVFIVLLQKETGLVTINNPQAWRYQTATGYGCPDSTPGVCDSKYNGFTNQLKWAGTMFRAILNNSPTWYAPYTVGLNTIKWNPANSCGTSQVTIENRTTAALYSYTPYRPNQAALNAGYGTGDSCSSYGNRNFYQYFKDWFGDPLTGVNESYVARYYGQSNYPSMKPGESAYSYVMYKNAGKESWYDDRAVNAGIAPSGVGPVRLGTYNPSDRSSIFGNLWGSNRNRPSINFANVYEADGVTLAGDQRVTRPGQIVKFGFISTAPQGLSPAIYQEFFRPVVESYGYMDASSVFLNHTILPDYRHEVVAKPQDTTVEKGGQQWFFATYKNTGNTYWYDDYAVNNSQAPFNTKPLRLSTSNPDGRTSAFGQLWGSSGNRPSIGFNTVYESDGVTKASNQHLVKTGQVLKFGYIASGPTYLPQGDYYEDVKPVIEGFGYSQGPNALYKMLLREPYSQKWLSQSPYPTIRRGGSAYGYVEYKNTGTRTWYDDYAIQNGLAPAGTKPVRLATTAPFGRASLVGELWTPQRNRPSINFAKVYSSDGTEITNPSSQHKVEPGQSVRFGFVMTAPNSTPLGSREEWFIPFIEGQQEIPGSGVYLVVTITQ